MEIINKTNVHKIIILLYIVVFVWFFWSEFYVLDLFSHFYLQYFIVWFIALILSILLKDKLSVFITLILLIFLWSSIEKDSIIGYEKIIENDVYYLNANYNNFKPELIVEDIKKYNPKYVAIVELNKELYKKLKKEYKNVVYLPREASSLWFFTNEEIKNEIIHELTYPVLEINVDDISMYIIHPFPPLTSKLAEKQKLHFDEVSYLFSKNTSLRKLIIWDFNSSYYSLIFQKYFWNLKYKPLYSWSFWTPLMIPIDYVISNKDIFEINRVDFDWSDHSPIIIDIK